MHVRRPFLTSARTIAAFALALAAASDARADEGGKCTSAYERGQQLRIAKRLTEAASEFATCVLECPAVLAKDCRTWQDEVVRDIPHVIVRVIGSDGCEAKNQRLRLDDAPQTFAPGARMDLNPGNHKIGALGDGGAGAAHEEIFTVEPGETKKLDVVLQVKTCEARPIVGPPPPTTTAEPTRPVPVPAWILGGIGVAGVASFIGFGAWGLSQRGDLDDRCKPSCPDADVDKMQTTYLVADISLAVGAVGLAAALYLYFTRPTIASSGGLQPASR